MDQNIRETFTFLFFLRSVSAPENKNLNDIQTKELNYQLFMIINRISNKTKCYGGQQINTSVDLLNFSPITKRGKR